MTPPGHTIDQSRSADEWERAWRRHWRKTAFTPYELNLGGSNGAYRERSFLMQQRTLDWEQVRLNCRSSARRL